MKRIVVFLLISLLMSPCAAVNGDYRPADYVWTAPSHNSSESMPCGGYDIGMNVWVEQSNIYIYVSRSGWFDANNTLLKAGRFRLALDPNPFENGTSYFRQSLILDDGSVEISVGGSVIRIWADTYSPVIYYEVNSKNRVKVSLSYESWRYKDRLITKAECQQCSYKWMLPVGTYTRRDTISAERHILSFRHINSKQTVFDFTVHHEGLDSVKSQLYNPIGGACFGGVMYAPDLEYESTTDGKYASTDFKSWNYSSPQSMRHTVVSVALDTGIKPINAGVSRKRSAAWWHSFWQRSYIIAEGAASHIVRNYELFRYMLGCNAKGVWPTKFNGGLFTFDPVYVDASKPFTPDFRNWGGGTMTAQNQRLVYWPMLKSGDVDMMSAQLDTYLRMLPSAKVRVAQYWHHGGACYTEQMENFGLPNVAEYGAKRPVGFESGVESNAWLEYLWDTSLEFCQMALDTKKYANCDIMKYEDMIKECLHFFDEHYRYLSLRRGAKSLDGDGHLVIYPGSCCETYKMAYNPSSTISALRRVLTSWGKDSAMLSRIPEIPLRMLDGDTCIAPAVVWGRINNEETPQLYAVFPWRWYGVGRPHLDVARNTYLKDADAVRFRSSKGWKQDNIWAACLGMTDEAVRLAKEKFADGPYRFPAFWEPGFDWAPDHNRGGAAMIGLQEMLLQETEDGRLLLFPSWPKDWNARFRLHASGGRVVDAEIKDGIIEVKCYK